MSDSVTRWNFAARGDKFFVYYKFERMPTFTFVRKGQGSPYKGHGKTFMRQTQIQEWVKEQAKP